MGKNNKKSNRIFYIIGTMVLVVMLSFTVVNFLRDSRLLEKPVLSKVADKSSADSKSTAPDGYKTLKYKKSTDTGKTKSKPAKTPKPATKPTPTVTPMPTGEP